MKRSTLTIVGMLLLLGLASLFLSVAGCGTEVGSGKTTLAEARRVCEEWEPLSDDEWDATVIFYSETANLDVTKAEFLLTAPGVCVSQTDTEEMASACIVCLFKLIDATW